MSLWTRDRYRFVTGVPTAADHTINQRIFETSLDLILVVSRRGEIIRVSPSSQRILGYAPEHMVGTSAQRFLYPDDLDSTREEMRLARRGRETRNFECRYVHKNGHPVPLAWTGVWSELEEQHFFIGRDMTERLEAEQRLRRSQRLESIGQLTGGIAHDFNNLLAVVIGNLDLALQELDDKGKAARNVHRAHVAALNGAELTAQLLAFARRQSLNTQIVDMNRCVVETLTMLQRTLGEAIEIETRLADDLWSTLADPTQLESAVVNLSLNARDAMPDGGRLVIETANVTVDEGYSGQYDDVAPGDYTMLSVSDTGTGMSAETAARIFEPFFTTKETDRGTGMGLSMVFGFASQSNGDIKVYSELGIGTTFRLYLPRGEGAVAAVAVDAAQTEPAPAKSGARILVAEDNPDVRSVVIEQLVDLGYEVEETASGEAALDYLKCGGTADLLFTDIVMGGGMSGIDLAREVHKSWPELKVLLTSGFAPGAFGQENESDLQWPVLTKPYRKVKLAEKLSEVLEG